MAKRKRLAPAGEPGGTPDAADRTDPVAAVTAPREFAAPPVARIAGDAATRAALDELAGQMRAARDNGRMVIELPLAMVAVDHLTRDRLHFDQDDMAALKASLRDRGQQTPIEVVALAAGRYGLISGARRMTALASLLAETGEDRFGRVLALVRPFPDASAAYLAMVEENEIRSDLSFYERARLAEEAVRLGLYETAGAAVRALFVHAPPAKRSKILNFVSLHRALGPALRFPEAIPEKLGLALAKLLDGDAAAAGRLGASLRDADPQDASAERAVLDRAVALASAGQPPQTMPSPGGGRVGDPSPPSGEPGIDIAPGVRLAARPGRALLTGRGVDEALLSDLVAWLSSR